MRCFKGFCLLIIFSVFLTGCADVEKSPPSTNLTIEPYNLSEKESLLINKTGVGRIEFFMLNGTLKEDEDLQFSVEVFENGEYKEQLFRTYGGLETNFKDSIISTGINNNTSDEDKVLQIINGYPSGITTTYYPNEMTASSFSKLIDEKIILEKNKPIYLAAWVGTTQNSLGLGGSGNGELPSRIKESELAIVFKIVWTDEEKTVY